LQKRGQLKYFIAFAIWGLTIFNANANNITISNTSLTGRDVSAGVNNAANFSSVQFDLTWNNSWRSGATNNWDAAWVFVKFRLGSADYLSTAGATSSGSTITVNTTSGLRVGMPVFVNSGTGTFTSGTIITAITGSTTFTVNNAPTTPLSNNAVVRAERIWEHCWLNNTGHSKGSIGSSGSLQVGLQDEASSFNATTNPALGAYFYRPANGTGTYTTTGAQLRWNYGAQGIKDNDIVDVQVFATEMVYVPTATHNIDTAQYLSDAVLLINGDGTSGAQNNTFIDGSSNNFTVTRNGNATQGTFSPFCGSGGSGYFDGNGDYLTIADNAALQMGTGDFTIEFWINYTSLNGYPTPFSKGYTSAGALLFQTGANNGLMIVYANGSPVISETGTGTTGNWIHYALVRNGTTLTLYRNGSSVGSVTNSTNFNNTDNFAIGDRSGGGTPLNGYLSNFRIVKGTAVYTSSFTPSTSPLTAVSGTSLLLNFENAAINDSRRKNNIETAGDAQISTTQSKFGGASMYFDALGGDALIVPASDNLNFGTGDFTIELWAYAAAAHVNYRNLVTTRPNMSNFTDAFSLGVGANGVLYIYTNGWNIQSSTNAMPVGQWCHIAFVRSSGTATIYANGVSVGTSSFSYNLTRTLLGIGASPVSAVEPFLGYIDDLRITKGAALYKANFTPPTAALPLPNNGGSYPISSENAITLGGTAAANLKYRNPNVSVANDFNNTTTQTLPASFPKGYNGFYAMKYEVCQQQWIDFFNSLSSIQKNTRDITAATGKNTDLISFRNNISWTGTTATLNSSTHGNVACNWLNWPDAAAYCDWAGLRPMTELEFEKAARGTGSPLAAEPASGSTCTGDANITQASGISNSGADNETPSNSSANAVYGNNGSVQGPLRTGASATSSSTRTAAGAGYYGLMDMSDNVAEMVVSIGNSTGRNFTGAHGNGALNADGNADISTWPGYVSNAVTGATGSGERGGSWEDVVNRLYISDRLLANTAITTRDRNSGFRAVRSLPTTVAQ
jgi:formylglycine-generating enzyme required for sulfatase activity